ncbi:MAG: adenosylhomocysteinase, partial [Desulfurococcales archaeon]|nr:adenosylhomocysteinase [Desulfurococcales archaeon]
MPYQVADISLADQGRNQINWALKHMPVLKGLMEEFARSKPFEGVRVSAVLHVTKETGVLMLALKAGGAEVWLAGSNPLSTQDDVAAYLANEGINVFAWRGESQEEYYSCIARVAEAKPDVVLDDGADLHAYLHGKGSKLAQNVWGGTEETTTGVIRLRSLEREGKLIYP